MTQLLPGVEATEKGGLYYVLDDDRRPKRIKPWLGDCFSFFYDAMMENSLFPKKLGADIRKHYDILKGALADVHGQSVLELATGSGSATRFLPSDNRYTGADISTGMMKRAIRRFANTGFSDAEFYVASADDLPFADESFEVCLCVLALNFLPDADKALDEVRRVLVAGGKFVCSVPVPERNKLTSTIRGALRTEEELRGLCRNHGLEFSALPDRNGVLLYFCGTKPL